MFERENIIKRLEHVIGPAAWKIGGGVVVNAETIQDVIALLKAQEPRLLNPDDFKNNPQVDRVGRLPCWVEYKYENYSGWSFVGYEEVKDQRYHRFWTSRPTNEKSKVTPWEPAN